MNVVLFGATGMVGSGVLKACLADDRVTSVLVVGRRPCGVAHEKIREVVDTDLPRSIESAPGVEEVDACFFCLGVSALGRTEAAYRRVTYDLTLAIARALVARCRALVFCYVSGVGTDSSERGRAMWARVKGRTENALLGLPFAAAHMFRPGYVQPVRGVRSGTRLYRVAYKLVGWAYPVLKRVFPRSLMTSEELGQAMIEAAAGGAAGPVLEPPDILALASRAPGS